MTRIAMMSTHRVTCGVALYQEELSNELSKISEIKVFAENIIPPQVENAPLNPSIKLNYERCWTRGQGYNEVEKKILEYKPDILHVQFVAGVFGSLDYKVDSPFQKFIETLRNNGIKICITLHDIPHHGHGSTELTEWYKALHAKFFVMNIDMSAILREWYVDADINLIPLGTPIFTPSDKKEARTKLGLSQDDFILSQIGFLGIDKDMLSIVKAIPSVKIPNFKLIFAGGFHPLASPVHRPHVLECMKTAVKLGVQKQIVFANKVLTEEEINLYASASDFLILNQEMVFGGSTSASAHRILCAGKPIIMSQSGKLSEFIHTVNCVKCYPDKISDTLNSLYADKALQEKIAMGALQHAQETSFAIVAQKTLEVYNQ